MKYFVNHISSKHLNLAQYANGEQSYYGDNDYEKFMWGVHSVHWKGDLGSCPLLFSSALNDSNEEQQIEILLKNLNLNMSDDLFSYFNTGVALVQWLGLDLSIFYSFLPQKGQPVYHSLRVTCLSLNKGDSFVSQKGLTVCPRIMVTCLSLKKG